MYATTSIAAAVLLFPLATLAQAATATAPDLSQQTIVPFQSLPACAHNCGPLYDAQGACSPPIQPASKTQTCFCAYGKLQPLFTGPNDVCLGQCDAAGLQGIQSWFLGLCQKGAAQQSATDTGNGAGSTATGTAAPGSAATTPASSGGTTGGPWVNTHWQWIIMIVVLTLGIALAWVAACLLRRRYVRKKEREYELRPPVAPWVAGQPHPGAPGPYPNGNAALRKGKDKETTQGMYVSRPLNPARVSTQSAKWVVKERT